MLPQSWRRMPLQRRRKSNRETFRRGTVRATAAMETEETENVATGITRRAAAMSAAAEINGIRVPRPERKRIRRGLKSTERRKLSSRVFHLMTQRNPDLRKAGQDEAAVPGKNRMPERRNTMNRKTTGRNTVKSRRLPDR